jgi:hypothetical protein
MSGDVPYLLAIDEYRAIRPRTTYAVHDFLDFFRV